MGKHSRTTADSGRRAGRPTLTAAPRDQPGGTRLSFLGRFVGVWTAGAILLASVPAVEETVVRLTVLLSAWQAPVLGMRPVVVGADLFVSGARATVTPECTALLPSLILVATIAAVPASASERAWGLATLLPAFWLFNQGRIAVLMATLARRPEAFTIVHSVLWQGVSFVAIIGLVLAWTRGLRSRDA